MNTSRFFVKSAVTLSLPRLCQFKEKEFSNGPQRKQNTKEKKRFLSNQDAFPQEPQTPSLIFSLSCLINTRIQTPSSQHILKTKSWPHRGVGAIFIEVPTTTPG